MSHELEVLERRILLPINWPDAGGTRDPWSGGVRRFTGTELDDGAPTGSNDNGVAGLTRIGDPCGETVAGASRFIPDDPALQIKRSRVADDTLQTIAAHEQREFGDVFRVEWEFTDRVGGR